MKITADEARAYFAHPSQRRMGLDPQDLPDWAEYRASGPVCLIFHQAPWPNVWMVHVGVKPEGWGHIAGPTKQLLAEFRHEQRATRIVAWIEDKNRAAIALARRCGFETDGAFPGVIMMGWQECPQQF